MKQITFFGLLLIGLALGSHSLLAQSQAYNDVKKFSTRGGGAIITGNVVQGYYTFYKVEKVDRKTNAYNLSILDQDLNEVVKKRIVGPKHLYLLEASFATETLMLRFYDIKERRYEYHQYDGSGTLRSKKTFDVTNKVLQATINQTIKQMDDSEVEETSLYSIPERGFVAFHPEKKKKTGYSINFLPEEKGAKGWRFDSPADAKEVQSPLFLAANEDILVTTVSKAPNAFSKDVTFDIMALDMNTGKKLFSKPLNDKETNIQLLNAYLDDEGEKLVILGLYYDKDDKSFKDKSLGMCALEMDLQGKVVTRNYISWGKDVAEFLPVNEKGKIEDVGYLYFHRFIQTQDGRIFGVAEQYRKAVSGGAVALNALALASGGRSNLSNFKIVIEDMVIMEFDPSFSLKDVQIFDKGKSNIALPSGAGFVNPQVLSLLCKAYGAFDYSFTLPNEERSMFSVGYVDYDRIDDKAKKRSAYFGALTYAGGEITQDKIQLDETEDFVIYPGKPGHIVISTYDRKAKTIDIRLEKINY